MRPCKVVFALMIGGAAVVSGQTKPVAAVFPLGGDSPAELRDKVGFSIRTKLDRDGHYESIDGPTLTDLVGETPITLSTSPGTLAALVKDQSPEVFIWGELDGPDGHAVLKLKTLELRKPGARATEIDRPINAPTDVRFAVEDVLASLPGVGKFEHPSEQAASTDPNTEKVFMSRPNLLPDGDFTTGEPWAAVLRDQRYTPSVGSAPPDVDRVAITMPKDPKAMNALAMNLSNEVAESNGLACLSGPVTVRSKSQYRLRFQYRSDGPRLHVFVKGYVPWKNMAGQPDEKQTYERQVPPEGETHGEWVTVTCDLDPTTSLQPPTVLRVDLYAYLRPGLVWFRDVELKPIDLH